MKDNINILGDDFISEVAQYIMEERVLSEKLKEYNEAKNKLKKSNKKRIETIANIRTNKIEEINKELELTKKKLQNLKDEIKNIYIKYCEKNGHKLVLVNKRLIKPTGRHSFKEGFEYEMVLTYKCKVCGKMEKEIHKGYGYSINNKNYEKEIPYEIYDDVSLSETGKSIREIEKEIEELENNINYLIFLKERICELFGHEAKRIGTDAVGNDIFKCNCCEKEMVYRDYINAHYNAKYRDIIPYYYTNSKETPIYIMKEPKNTQKEDLYLPTYEDYQKKLVLKKENEDKN